jgi:hypothetical protein
LTGTWKAALSRIYLMPDEGARADGLAPYRPDAEKIFNYRLKMSFDGRPVAESVVYCRPGGLVHGLTTPPYPIQMFHSQDKIWQLVGDRDVRVIYLNQDHPKDLKPSYMGHSVGRWEGNTLVVDTIGFKDGAWLDREGSPASQRLHVVERISKAEDGSSFNDDITVDDPEYYTQPFTIKVKFLWHPDIKPWNAFCEEDRHIFVVHGLQTER